MSIRLKNSKNFLDDTKIIGDLNVHKDSVFVLDLSLYAQTSMRVFCSDNQIIDISISPKNTLRDLKALLNRIKPGYLETCIFCVGN